MFVTVGAGAVAAEFLVGEYGTPRCVRWGCLDGSDPRQVARAEPRAMEFRTPERPRLGDGRVAGLESEAVGIPVVPGTDEFWVWSGGLRGHRGDQAWTPRFRLVGVDVDDPVVTPDAGAVRGERMRTTHRDDEAMLELVVRIAVDHGVLRVSAEVTNLADEPYSLDGLALVMPVPGWADELLDFAGRWSLERVPQRHPFSVGQLRRESRWGRPNHEQAFCLVAGEHGFDFARGEVFACHLAWSGNHEYVAERTMAGDAFLGAGELLLPGEILLGPGHSYRSPDALFAHGDGLDDLSARFHDLLRNGRDRSLPPRPVNYNSWEAVGHFQKPDVLLELAEKAAAAGAERFVVDDGWFGTRMTGWGNGLGDWVVNPDVHPRGLKPIADRVHGLGMQFGLWFEPEMMSSTSEVAARHPEWLMTAHHEAPSPGPADQVMNLAAEGAEEHVRESMLTLVRALGIDYIKWDHNRPLSSPGDAATGQPVVHDNVLAVYRIVDALHARFPALEIESCAGGGGRVDLGMLSRADRIWVSDSMDCVDRVDMQSWTSLLVPPEMMGSHVGMPTASISRRTFHLDFRGAISVFAHFGIEWDLLSASDDDLTALRHWVGFATRHRALVQGGRFVRRLPGDGTFLWGSISPDRHEALYLLGTTRSTLAASPGPVRLPGLDPATSYRVEGIFPGDAAPSGVVGPAWFGTPADAEPPALGGDHLMRWGVAAPLLRPESAVFLHAMAQDRS